MRSGREKIQRRRASAKGKKKQIRRVLKEARTRAHGSPSRPMMARRDTGGGEPTFEQVYEELMRQREGR